MKCFLRLQEIKMSRLMQFLASELGDLLPVWQCQPELAPRG